MSDNPATGTKKSLHGVEGFIFVFLLIPYIFILPRWADWNVNSRMDLVLAIADQNTLAIDAYYQNTGDYAYYNEHFYSDKAPGSSFAALPFYLAFKYAGGRTLAELAAPRIQNSALGATLFSEGRGLIAESVYFFSALVFVTCFTSAVPSALLGVLLYRLAQEWANSQWAALIGALAFGLATPAFAYANNLYGHQLSAFLLFGGFCTAYRVTRGKRLLFYAALTGLALGTALITEYPTGLIVVGIGLYALFKWRSPRLVAIACAAGILPLLLMAGYNWSIFQTPLPVGYLYSPLYQDLHKQGLISLTYPKLGTLVELAFGTQRGLFLLSPFLLLAVPGFYFMARQRELRSEFLVTLWSVVSFFLFNSSSEMWQGGFAVGPRYLVPMLPFLALPVPFVLARAKTLWARAAIALLIGISFVLLWIVTLGGQLFPQYQTFPLVEYSLPSLLQGSIARNLGMFIGLRGLASLVPLAAMLGIVTLVFWWFQHTPETSARRVEQNSPLIN